jgi:hypothetical protein
VAAPWTIELELDLVLSTAANSLLSLVRTLNDIGAEKPDRRSIALKWHVKRGDEIMHGLALIWLGKADPVEAMEATRAEDPELSALREVLGAWAEVMVMWEHGHKCHVLSTRPQLFHRAVTNRQRSVRFRCTDE